MLLTALPFSRAGDDQPSYKIKLEHPARKGEKGSFELSTAHRTTSTTNWDGYPKPVTDEKAVGDHLIADVEVVEVDEKGNAIVQSYVIRSFTTLKDQKEVEVLPAGTKVVARANKDGTDYSVNGVPPEDSLKESLRRAITLEGSSGPNTWDVIYGTPNPKRVRETWPFNVKAAAEVSKGRGYLIKPEDMSGEGELVAVEPCDGLDCLHVRVTSNAKKITSVPSEWSAPYKLVGGSIEGTHEWVFPVDETKGTRRSSRSYTMRYTYDGQREGRHYVMEQVTQSETVAKRLDPDTGDGPATQP